MTGQMTGRIIAVVAPSGAGKDTLLKGVLATRPDLHLARRVITRRSGAGGEDFEAVSVAEFERRRTAGAFAVWWPAHGLKYGVPVSVHDRLAAGQNVIFNGSRDALPAIRTVFPDLAVILITAPAALLRDRLRARGRESADEIEERLRRAERPVPTGAVEVANDASIKAGIAQLSAAIDTITFRPQGG